MEEIRSDLRPIAAAPYIRQLAPLRQGSSATLFGWAISLAVAARFLFYVSRPVYGTTPVDEVVALALLVYAPFGFSALSRRVPSVIVMSASLLYLLIIATSSFLLPFSTERGYFPLVLGLALDFKMFVLLFGFAGLAARSYRKGAVPSDLRLVCVTLIIIAIVDVPFTLHDLISTSDIYGNPLLRRGTFSRPAGLFHHPVPNSQALLFGAIAAATLIRRRLTLPLIMAFGSLLVCVALSLQVKETILVGFVVLAVLFIGTRMNMASIVAFVFLVLASLAALIMLPVRDNPLLDHFNANFSEQEDTVRSTLYRVAPQIAEDNFPLGAGVSTFGSEGSRTNGYSSLYKKYGVWGLWGATETNDRYLLDTYWPKVLAESGFFGLACWAIIVLVGLLSSLSAAVRTRSPEMFFCFLVIASATFLSTAMQAFLDELVGPLFFFALALTLATPKGVAQLIDRTNESGSLQEV